jgi:hypothetical protein
MKTILILMIAVSVFASTTSVKIEQNALSNLNSLSKKQIGVSNATDDTLGFRPWGGKDTGSVVTYWLAKNQHAKVKNIWQDTARGKASYSARDTSVFHKSDSSHDIALRGDRFYFGLSTGDTLDVTINKKDVKIPDSTKGVILKSKNGTARKYWRIQVDSAGALSADSAGLN